MRPKACKSDESKIAEQIRKILILCINSKIEGVRKQNKQIATTIMKAVVNLSSEPISFITKRPKVSSSHYCYMVLVKTFATTARLHSVDPGTQENLSPLGCKIQYIVTVTTLISPTLTSNSNIPTYQLLCCIYNAKKHGSS